MCRIITYGTFDLFHQGHYKLLNRAKQQGDYLIVGVTTENYDKNCGELNVQESLMKRIQNVKDSGFADEIIIEEYEGQKIEDILKYKVDKIVVGSDWKGKFDYLSEYCEVIYLDMTKGISSTELRKIRNKVIKLGVVGVGRIANRFIVESKYVSGVNVEGVFGIRKIGLENFVEKHELSFYEMNYDKFLERVDAVYVASPHLTHYEYIKKALSSGKHVLSEKPMVLDSQQAYELYDLAKKNEVVLLEAIKTAYGPGFQRMVTLAKSGAIGVIKDVEATFTKLTTGEMRELDFKQAGGSITELGSYPLIAIIKLLGTEIKDIDFYSNIDEDKQVDL